MIVRINEPIFKNKTYKMPDLIADCGFEIVPTGHLGADRVFISYADKRALCRDLNPKSTFRNPKLHIGVSKRIVIKIFNHIG
jgi:hypothetical protein